MKFIKQCKGKDLDKVPESKLEGGLYLCSKKYDGNYVQIHKIGDSVSIYTSGGKRFEIEEITDYLVRYNPHINFVIEAEYIAHHNGELGGRHTATTTSMRTKTSKGISNFDDKAKFMAFDIIYYHNLNLEKDCDLMSQPFIDRLEFFKSVMLGHQIMEVEHEVMTLEMAKVKAKNYVDWNDGEGYIAKKGTHIYRPSKRVNDAIKIKFYPKQILECIGTKPGEGKYTGMIGSLILKDMNGEDAFLSGITDEQRQRNPEYFIGKNIEFEYEHYNKTYVQARFKRIVT